MEQPKIASVEEVLIRALDRDVGGLFTFVEEPPLKVADLDPGTLALVAELETAAIQAKLGGVKTKVVGKALKQVGRETLEKGKKVVRKVFPSTSTRMAREKELLELEKMRQARVLAEKSTEATKLQPSSEIWRKLHPPKSVSPTARAALVGVGAGAPVAGAYVVTREKEQPSVVVKRAEMPTPRQRQADAIVAELLHESSVRPEVMQKVAEAGRDWIEAFDSIQQKLAGDVRAELSKPEMQTLADAFAKVATASGIEVTGSEILDHVKEATVGGIFGGIGRFIGGASRVGVGTVRGGARSFIGSGVTTAGRGPLPRAAATFRGARRGAGRAFEFLPSTQRARSYQNILKARGAQQAAAAGRETGQVGLQQARRRALQAGADIRRGRKGVGAVGAVEAARAAEAPAEAAGTAFTKSREATRAALKGHRKRFGQPRGVYKGPAPSRPAAEAAGAGVGRGKGTGAGAATPEGAEAIAKKKDAWPGWAGPAALLAGGYVLGKQGAVPSDEKEGSLLGAIGLGTSGYVLYRGAKYLKRVIPAAAKGLGRGAKAEHKLLRQKQVMKDAPKAGLSVSTPEIEAELATQRALQEATARKGLTSMEKAIVYPGAGVGGLMLGSRGQKQKGPQVNVTRV